MAIRRCPNCGCYKIKPTPQRKLPRLLTFFLPLQAGQCVYCRWPRLRVIWRQVPLKLGAWALGISAFFFLSALWGTAEQPPRVYTPTLASANGHPSLTTYQALSPTSPQNIETSNTNGAERHRLKQKVNELEAQITPDQTHRARPNKSRTPSGTAKTHPLPNSNHHMSNSAASHHSAPSNGSGEKVANTGPNPVGDSAADDMRNVLQSIERWRLAWQSQHLEAYISQYTYDFGTSNGNSRKGWLEERKIKLTRPKAISIKIENIHLNRRVST